MGSQDQSSACSASGPSADGGTFPAPSDGPDGCPDTGADPDLGCVLAFGGVSLANDRAGLDLDLPVADTKMGQADGNSRYAFDATARVGVHHQSCHLGPAGRHYITIDHDRLC